MKLSVVFSLVCCLLLMSGCGGGGGSGSSDSPEGSDSSGVRILHAVLDGSPYLVASSADPNRTTRGMFAYRAPYKALPGEEQTLSLSSVRDSGRALFSFSTIPSNDLRQSVFVYGNNTYLGLKATLLNDITSDTPADSSQLRILNGLAGASAVEVDLNSGEKGVSLSFGGVSEYLTLTAGTIPVSVKRKADQQGVLSQTLTLAGGRAYTLLLAGEVDYLVLGKLYDY